MAVYILYYDFASTSGNHAGMSYLAQKLKVQFPEVQLIKHFPQEVKGGRFWVHIHTVLLFCYLFIFLKPGDKVFFMEYLTYGVAFQDRIAKWLKRAGKSNKLIGLVHLAGSHLLDLYGDEKIISQKLSYLDKIVVFGSSLASFIRERGFNKEITICHHYVDSTFYHPQEANGEHEKLHVIIVGRLKRNFEQLNEIITKAADNVVFHLCLGDKPLPEIFKKQINVKAYGFLSEEELLKRMQTCDVHLAVLEDTVGSNAITSAMAVGLVQVVSDVGSIRDYCNESNSILCTSVSDFTEALSFLSQNLVLVTSMKNSARHQAEKMSLENFYKSFPGLL